jgi:hypothetical protein
MPVMAIMETYILLLALGNTLLQVPYASEEECENHAWVEKLKHRFAYPSSAVCFPAEMVRPWGSGFTLGKYSWHYHVSGGTQSASA